MEVAVDVPSHVLEYALSMIDWRAPVKFRLVSYVHANRQRDARLTVLSLANTCEETGISPTIAHRQYGELVDAQVLERFDGGGPRGHAYRVSARFDLWQVPWLGERAPATNEAPSRGWLLKRNVALAQIDRLLRPPVESKDGTVARTGARLTATAARTYARLSSASRAPGRAAVGDLPARTGARLTRAEEGSTQLPLDRPSYLATSERANEVINALQTKAGAPVWGSPLRALRELVTDDNADGVLAALRSVPDGLPILALIDICEGAADGPVVDLTTPRTVRRECDNCGGGGMLFDEAAGGAIRCPMCNPAVTEPCETVPGGARP